MADPIKLVRGDNRPYIKLKLTLSDGSVVDLSAPTTVVTVRVRPVASEITAFTLTPQKVDGGVNGEVAFNFPGTVLDVEPGYYEAEVEISFGSEKQTVYDRLKFLVREQFN